MYWLTKLKASCLVAVPFPCWKPKASKAKISNWVCNSVSSSLVSFFPDLDFIINSWALFLTSFLLSLKGGTSSKFSVVFSTSTATGFEIYASYSLASSVTLFT